MAALQGKTREQLRVSIGHNLGRPFQLISANAAGGTTDFFTDSLVLGGADEHNGKWLLGTSGTNDGVQRRVINSAITNNRQKLTVYPALSVATASGDTAELWDEAHNPEDIHNFINDAIIEVTGLAWDPVENITLHSDGKTARYDIPTGVEMINKVEYRSRITSTDVHLMDRTFDETTDSDFTQATDTKDFKLGNGSLKLTIGSGVSGGDFITDSFTAVDLSPYDFIEGWVKATTTLAAADFVLRLDSGAVQGDPTDLEVLDVPATIAADTWTFFRIALATPELDTAIVSIGLEYNANQAANTVWFDAVRAVTNDTAIWTKLPKELWRIDHEARDLILSSRGLSMTNYSLLKLIGGDIPVLLTADATATEVSDDWIIKRAVASSLLSRAKGPSTDPDGHFQRAQMALGIAETAKRRMHMPMNARTVR